jgi:alpha-beta hydrolase superfamily lysophospholipase
MGSLTGCQSIMLHFAEPHFLKTGPNGPDTPQTFGAPYEHVSIPSDTRILDGYLVRAPDECATHSALLIFHGVMETISEWSAAQAFLRQHCVASLVFDYTGHGNSSPGGTVKLVNRDAVAAYRYFSAAFSSDQRLCVLGHSMGNGPMLEELPAFTAAPSCVVVASPLSSLRDWGVAHVSGLMAYMIPDVWNSVHNIARSSVPVLVIQSRSDTVNPIEMGRRVFTAAHEPKRMIEVDGFKHNAIYKTPSLIWWSPVLAFIAEEPLH